MHYCLVTMCFCMVLSLGLYALMCCYHVFLYGDVIGCLCITVLLPCVFVWCFHRVFMYYCVVTTCFVWCCHGVFMHNYLIMCVCKVRSCFFMNLCVVTTCVYMLSFLCIYEAFATVNMLLCDVLCVFMSCCDGLLSPYVAYLNVGLCLSKVYVCLCGTVLVYRWSFILG